MVTLDLEQQLLCIQYPSVKVAIKLQYGIILLLHTFKGLVGEDLIEHLKEFHIVCSSMKTIGVTKEQVKLRAFQFFLVDSANE